MSERVAKENPHPITLKVAQALCKAEGEYDWRYLKDVSGNPSTAYAYKTYLKMADAAIAAYILASGCTQ